MNYTGQFRNINNVLYQVDILTNNGTTGTTELTFSDSAFNVEYNGGKTIYEPFKLSNATCTIIDDSYHFDFYSSTAQGTKITLTNIDNGSIEWVGYLTPNIYTQGFEQEFETIELEAIDGLSTLEDYKYSNINGSYKDIVSFESLIINIIKKCNCYTDIYLPQTVQTTNYSSAYNHNVFKELFITEQNFYSLDDNEPMTYKEVFESILMFLGLTAVDFGSKIFILDFDGIKNNYNTYFKYSTTNNFSTYTYTTSSTLSNTKNITGSTDIKMNGSKIELDKTFNQIGIKTSMYYNDSVIPEIFNEDSLVTYDTDEDFEVNTTYNNKLTHYFYKFYKHNNYQSTYYNNTTNWTVTGNTGTTVNRDWCYNTIGATNVKYSSYYVADGAPASISYTDYLCLHTHLGNNATIPNNKVIYSTKLHTIPPASYLVPKQYFIIGGSGMWQNYEDFVMETKQYTYDTSGWNESQLSIECKLKVGNKYWTGSNWSTYDTNFALYFAKGSETHLYGKWFEVKNNVTYTDNIDTTGQKIPFTATDGLVGEVEFSILLPYKIPSMVINYVWLKDLKIELVNPSNTSNNDKVFKNVINDNYVNEFSEMDFKICSQSTENGSISYATPIEKIEGTNYFFRNNLYLRNRPLNTEQKQEYNVIEKYINQYSQPHKILKLSLTNNLYPYSKLTIGLFPSDTYIIDSMSIDYINDSTEIKIIEKV